MHTPRLAMLACSLGLLLRNPVVAMGETVAKNHVFIVFDSTPTYAHRNEAAQVIRTFLDAAKVTEHDPRRQPRSRLQVTLISLDAYPRAVWSGSEYDLQQIDGAFWERLFTDRRAYQYCSDVVGALKVVAELLPTDRCAERPYVYLLTDFLNEPPAKRGCKAASYDPQGVPFDAFTNVPVKALFVPKPASAAWEPALRTHKLADTFLLFPTVGPDGGLLVPPVPSRCKPAAGEREAVLHRVTLAVVSGAGVVLFAVLGPVLFALRRGR